ncbi:hypothetical protein HPP92_002068 [Vanilla planifolia]|uniref:Uncharacterized protein n=1 Tax=Vanilla planifolia TaxID=51239 RepID=A0A835VFY2_VANPL|nr:hypothetical protein HPP92_002068 [Vanilla planifolia]
MAQKHMENAIEQKGGKLLKYVMEVIDIDGPVFEDNLPTENIFLIQSVEFSKLVGMLKPEEPEDVILSACTSFLHSLFSVQSKNMFSFPSMDSFLLWISLKFREIESYVLFFKLSIRLLWIMLVFKKMLVLWVLSQ